MSEINKLLPILIEKTINNQAILTVIIKELAIFKSSKSNKTKEEVLEELMKDVNIERNIISKSIKI